MAEKKLYKPDELELVGFLRDGERYIDGYELLERASEELDAVQGAEQFEFLWDNHISLPKDWRQYWILVPNPVARVVLVLYWVDFNRRWCHRDVCRLDAHFYDDRRLLRPSE